MSPAIGNHFHSPRHNNNTLRACLAQALKVQFTVLYLVFVCGIPPCLAEESHFATTMWRKCQLFNTILWFIALNRKASLLLKIALALRFECIPTNKRKRYPLLHFEHSTKPKINNIAGKQLKRLCRRKEHVTIVIRYSYLVRHETTKGISGVYEVSTPRGLDLRSWRM